MHALMSTSIFFEPMSSNSLAFSMLEDLPGKVPPSLLDWSTQTLRTQHKTSHSGTLAGRSEATRAPAPVVICSNVCTTDLFHSLGRKESRSGIECGSLSRDPVVFISRDLVMHGRDPRERPLAIELARARSSSSSSVLAGVVELHRALTPRRLRTHERSSAFAFVSPPPPPCLATTARASCECRLKRSLHDTLLLWRRPCGALCMAIPTLLRRSANNGDLKSRYTPEG